MKRHDRIVRPRSWLSALLLWTAGCATSPGAAASKPAAVDPASSSVVDAGPSIDVAATRPVESEPLLTRVAFMAGDWVDDDPAQGVVVEERWTPVLGGTMLGTTRTVVNGRIAFYEYLRLEERGDGVVYVVLPKGGDATPFALVRGGRDLAVFENLGPEFPRRIIYRRDGDVLFTTFEGPHEGKIVSSEWRYRRR